MFVFSDGVEEAAVSAVVGLGANVILVDDAVGVEFTKGLDDINELLLAMAGVAVPTWLPRVG